MSGRTYFEIKRQEARDKVRDILFDRWDIDQVVGDPRAPEIQETLDEIEKAYVPLMLVPPKGSYGTITGG